ncbi:hypothetical protein [Calidifontibacillus oryziterrae]|uniref:hypothetical protein n=1 Tax=Calidifontibacillus oryziterrae TaxID=1191699 RepID=UPI00030EDD44|nr:hypothetical protein [Calidifontibacillus oryziterrae]
MTTKKLSVSSMILLIIAAAVLAASIFFPWWGMKFFAPQYPEGLDIIVYPYKLEDQNDVAIINGLNHYIGMKEFSEENFPELNYLSYIIGAMALITLVVAIIRNRKLLIGLISLFIIGGGVGIFDIHRWLKSYGTNLDPMAPIDVPPFVPPIIGENTIANFVTNSYFSTGFYMIGIAFILMVIPLWKEREK